MSSQTDRSASPPRARGCRLLLAAVLAGLVSLPGLGCDGSPAAQEEEAGDAPVPAAPSKRKRAKRAAQGILDSLGRAAGGSQRLTKQSQQYLGSNWIDPNAVVQTGPGRAQWQWDQVPLRWTGPVSQQQQIKPNGYECV